MSGLPTSVARDLTVYRDAAGRVLFGAGHVDLVVWLEASFPDGVWVEDEDGRPLYTFGAREGGLVTLKSPALPENAPTAEETSAAVNAMRQVVGRPAEGASANPEWEKLLDNARGYSPRLLPAGHDAGGCQGRGGPLLHGLPALRVPPHPGGARL